MATLGTQERRRRPFLQHAAPGLSIVLVLLTLGSFAPSAEAPTEYEVKAALLYNFGRFVQWPNSGDTLVVCVLGEDPFGPVLDKTLEGKITEARRLHVRRLKRSQDGESCQILFVSSSEYEHLPQILAELDGRSVLTVGDTPEFARRGGMISFQLEQNRVRIHVNLRAAEGARLTISSQLLKLATVDR
jgi:hypothetical protein